MHNKTIRTLMIIFLFTIAVATSMTPSTMVSWSVHVTRMTDFPYVDTHPFITQTNDAKIWVIWAQETFENLALTYKTSSDLGATWSDEMNLTKIIAEGQNSCPSMTQTEDGTIWVVWQSDRPPPPPPPLPDFSINASPQSLIIPKNSSDTSNITITSLNDFNKPVDLMVSNEPTNVTTTLDPPQVTPPPNGTANSTLTVTVGTTALPGNYTLTVFARAQSGPTHLVNIALEITEATTAASYSDTFSDTSSFTTEETDAEITYDYEIYYKTSSDYGATWSNDTQLTDNALDDVAPSIIQLTNGTILVVWQSDSPGNTDIFCQTSSDGGTSWSNATPLTTDSNSDRHPSVTQTNDERIWVAWHSNRFGDYEVFSKVYSSSWSDDVRRTSSTNHDTGPSILQTLDGTIWLFWSSLEPVVNATSDLYYKVSFDNGATWSERVQFTTDPYDDSWPSVTQTNDTKIWVVWASNRADQPYPNWEIWCTTSLPGDLNDDGVVDINDLTRVKDAYGAIPGDPRWDATTDITKDDIIDIYDLAIVGRDYGAT